MIDKVLDQAGDILSVDELKLLHKVAADVDVRQIERVSDREYDVRYEGVYREGPIAGCGISAWLPLAAIYRFSWVRLASMSDYPEMVRMGDWSGIRDSSKEAQWAMFAKVLGKEAA